MSHPYTDEYGYPLSSGEVLLALASRGPELKNAGPYKDADEYFPEPTRAIIPKDTKKENSE